MINLMSFNDIFLKNKPKLHFVSSNKGIIVMRNKIICSCPSKNFIGPNIRNTNRNNEDKIIIKEFLPYAFFSL